jgi:serine phosphatase RsbU (regulator of sigma subunit)
VRLARLAWRGNREAQFLLVPFLLGNAIVAFDQSLSALYYFGLIQSLHAVVLYSVPGFTVYLDEVFNLASYLAVGAVLALRFTRSAERDERLSAEMAAAHAVQAQLVPAQLPATPHFGLATAYFAAGEVGGDFYQVFPKADGSVLIVVGDVSGKGLKAAMLGILVVGALRALAQDELPPAQILARLNMQLRGSSDGGLVTCLVLQLAPEGQAVIANAGHLAPYRNGEELQLESSFPLGIVAEAEYCQSSFALEQGDQLTFLSDGVVEAQNAHGELFGFERTRSISRQTAQQIAEAARRFGQEDDITVVTLSFAPAAVAIA